MVTAFLIKLKTVPTLAESSFFVMFAFILFNKQYSMQYVIWLTSLAVITLAYISKRNRESLIYIFIVWQAFELAFQYSFFQRILTNTYAKACGIPTMQSCAILKQSILNDDYEITQKSVIKPVNGGSSVAT